MDYININGKITTRADTAIPTDNGAFRYGYGLFETMLVQDSKIALKQYHWERLYAGLKTLMIELPVLLTPEYLEEQVLKTVVKNKLAHLCRVRLQIYTGGGGLFGTGNTHPGYVIESFPLDATTLGFNENGLVAGIATGLTKSRDTLSNLKSCNALIYAMAAQHAKTNKWNDALILNSDGHIIEGSIANLFWAKDGQLYTSPLSDGCVAGIMRRHIMQHVPVTQQSLSLPELLQADEVILTNAIKRLRWVKNIGDKQYSYKTAKKVFDTLFR